MEYVLHPESEIDDRIKRLQSQMNDIDGALLFDSVDMGYFSGTAQDGLVSMGHVMSGPEAAFPSFLASPTGGRGTSLFFPQGAGFRKIRRNEPVFVDTVGICEGGSWGESSDHRRSISFYFYLKGPITSGCPL